MICEIKGCTNKVLANGYCQKHNRRFLRHGDPNFINKEGRKRKPDPKKREKVMKSAEKLFKEKGYSVSMKEIMEDSGVGFIYTYFKSKKELYDTVM